MPSGRTHETIGKVAACGAYLTIVVITDNANTALWVACSILFSTYYLSPDLDIWSNASKRWGIAGFLWVPYRKLIRHRSKWSHSLIGGMLRLVYFITLSACAMVLASLLTFLYIPIDMASWQTKEVGLMIIGFIISDLLHIVTDKLVTRYKPLSHRLCLAWRLRRARRHRR